MPHHTNQSKQKRIKKLIAKIERGRDVQARDLAIVLTALQQQRLKEAWSEQKELRSLKKPAEVKEYESLLQKALLLNGMLERYCATETMNVNIREERREKAAQMRYKCGRAFERALDHLKGIVTADSSLRIWFDRNLEFGQDSKISFDTIGMPRVVTSRSLDCISRVGDRFGPVLTKRQLKYNALRSALAELDGTGRTNMYVDPDS